VEADDSVEAAEESAEFGEVVGGCLVIDGVGRRQEPGVAGRSVLIGVGEPFAKQCEGFAYTVVVADGAVRALSPAARGSSGALSSVETRS